MLTDCDCAASCEAAAEEALEEGEGLLLCHGGRGGDTVEMRRAILDIAWWMYSYVMTVDGLFY